MPDIQNPEEEASRPREVTHEWIEHGGGSLKIQDLGRHLVEKVNRSRHSIEPKMGAHMSTEEKSPCSLKNISILLLCNTILLRCLWA